jgi:uncharacterized membrane protein YkvA (DUF1232 family)
VTVVVSFAIGLLALYIALLGGLLLARPKSGSVTEVLRLLPDTLRLFRRLAADGNLPRRTRVRLWLLLGYLAVPIDLIPDFLPVIGYADDAILVMVVLRSVLRRAGPEVIRRHWPGSAEGLVSLGRLARLDLGSGRR